MTASVFSIGRDWGRGRGVSACQLLPILLAVAFGIVTPNCASEPDVLFSTRFDTSEGYRTNLTLIGQNGWVGNATIGNGIVSNFFEGFGQQAYVGFAADDMTNAFVSVWQPVGFAPIPADRPVVRFSVTMQIVDSTNERRDDFRWSIYNTNAVRLFTVDFDNQAQAINFALDNEEFVSTGFNFDNAGLYDLTIYMNFQRNLWSAWLNDVVIIHAARITTQRATLNFGDADAVWAVRDVGQAGDNFMVFDNYEVVSETFPAIPATLEWIDFKDGVAVFRFYGEPGREYSIEVSNDLAEWFTLGTYVAPEGGVFDFEDTTAVDHPSGFYRARLIEN